MGSYTSCGGSAATALLALSRNTRVPNNRYTGLVHAMIIRLPNAFACLLPDRAYFHGDKRFAPSSGPLARRPLAQAVGRHFNASLETRWKWR
jgi:hypothetical protein